MKQNLWILNSSLLIILGITLVLNFFLKKEMPDLKKRVAPKEEMFKKKMIPSINLEKIYQHDIFDTYSPTEKPEPKQKKLVSPIPEYIPHTIKKPPQIDKKEFIEPLKIKISGIISSSNENKSIAMITDETNKEKIYHLGDLVKDGQIIKITRNKIIFLRSNGQHDIFLLRKEDIPGEKTPEKWKYIIKKTNKNKFIINPQEISKNFQSLGRFIEDFSLIPAYHKGKIIGIQVKNIKKNKLSSMFGLNKNDIITSVNNIKTSETKNRIKIYDKIIQSQLNDIIKVSLTRNNKNIELSYKLEKIEKPSKKVFIEPINGKQNNLSSTKTKFKLSREQEQEKQMREFEKTHKTPKQQDIISDIRKRILKNMKSRSQKRRIR